MRTFSEHAEAESRVIGLCQQGVMRLNNATIMAIAAATFAFVLGFAYGNLFEVQYGFQLKDWQTLASTLVALGAATLAYMGVRGTQRINVMIKEQDRIEALLPGLRQVNELLLVIRGPLNGLRRQHRYQAILLLDAAIHMRPTESIEDAVRRQLPLADEHLRREVAEIIFALKSQATIVKVGHDEVLQYQTDVAQIHQLAPSSHKSLREIAKLVEASYERENDKLTKVLKTFDEFAESIKERILRAEERQRTIRGVVDRFFKGGS